MTSPATSNASDQLADRAAERAATPTDNFEPRPLCAALAAVTRAEALGPEAARLAEVIASFAPDIAASWGGREPATASDWAIAAEVFCPRGRFPRVEPPAGVEACSVQLWLNGPGRFWDGVLVAVAGGKVRAARAVQGGARLFALDGALVCLEPQEHPKKRVARCNDVSLSFPAGQASAELPEGFRFRDVAWGVNDNETLVVDADGAAVPLVGVDITSGSDSSKVALRYGPAGDRGGDVWALADQLAARAAAETRPWPAPKAPARAIVLPPKEKVFLFEVARLFLKDPSVLQLASFAPMLRTLAGVGTDVAAAAMEMSATLALLADIGVRAGEFAGVEVPAGAALARVQVVMRSVVCRGAEPLCDGYCEVTARAWAQVGDEIEVLAVKLAEFAASTRHAISFAAADGALRLVVEDPRGELRPSSYAVSLRRVDGCWVLGLDYVDQAPTPASE